MCFFVLVLVLFFWGVLVLVFFSWFFGWFWLVGAIDWGGFACLDVLCC